LTIALSSNDQDSAMTIDRRSLLSTSAAMIGAGVLSTAQAQTRGIAAAPSGPPPPVTQILARYITSARFEDLPANVRKEGTRTFLNWMGVAVGGSHHETVNNAVAALSPFSGKPEANLMGRGDKLDILNAALVNGISSHIFDYDDTHLKTIIHPAGPVASAILALSQHIPVSGRDFLNALVLGMETECRIGNAVYPSHYDLGWHITGSCGVFGGAAAAGKLLGLTEQQMAWALGLAASQPVGLKIQFGTMTKSFHAGRAAQNGLTAALLAAQNYTADVTALEGKDGWAQALSRAVNWAEVTEGLGTRYEAALNTYKPFACGIVAHPGIDAAIQLRNENKLTPDQIDSVVLHANPLVLSLMGKTEPKIGLEGKFSIYHCIAVGLIFGAAGERQFQDAVVRDPTVTALRHKVTVNTDPTVASQKCDLSVKLKNGKVLTKHIENAIGSLEKPLSDAALEAKFADLADGILPKAQAQKLMQLCWSLERAADVGAIAQAGAV
jgi:2-methylcitrate dehydratase PrpD